MVIAQWFSVLIRVYQFGGENQQKIGGGAFEGTGGSDDARYAYPKRSVTKM
jgi:hypothetical protein